MAKLALCLLCFAAMYRGTAGSMPPTQPVWIDDGKWPPRSNDDVMAREHIFYEDTCPQKNRKPDFGSEEPVACPPHTLNVDTVGAPAPPPPQAAWNNRMVPTLAPAPPDQGSLAPPGLPPAEMHADFFPYKEEKTHSMVVDRLVMHGSRCNSFTDDGSVVERDCPYQHTHRHAFSGAALTVPSRTFRGGEALIVPSDITGKLSN